MFRTGAFLSAGLVFGIQGIVYAAESYYTGDNSPPSAITSYLLQIYGGYVFDNHLQRDEHI